MSSSPRGYLAVVKYAVDATDAQKISALKEGMEECGMRLIDEFGLSLEDVEDAFGDALRWITSVAEDREDAS